MRGHNIHFRKVRGKIIFELSSVPFPPATPKLTFGVFVTESLISHITKSYSSFTTTIDKEVTFCGMELGSCDHFSQLLHIGWFYINYV